MLLREPGLHTHTKRSGVPSCHWQMQGSNPGYEQSSHMASVVAPHCRGIYKVGPGLNLKSDRPLFAHWPLSSASIGCPWSTCTLRPILRQYTETRHGRLLPNLYLFISYLVFTSANAHYGRLSGVPVDAIQNSTRILIRRHTKP
jgi:hypothetical protein